MMLVRVYLIHVTLQNTRSIIHWTTLQTGKRQHRGMESLISRKRLILCTTSRLVSDKVWIGTAKTCRTDSLVCIHHDVVFGCFCDTIKVMIIEPLPVMMLATRDDVAYITALYRIVSIFVHQVVCSLKMALVITN